MIAIDPGTKHSAYVFINTENLRPLEFGKIPNRDLINILKNYPSKKAAVEMVASYGMSVGAEVFETCVWIGMFTRELELAGMSVDYIYRKDVKINICGSMKASDANIRTALIDRFGPVGVKKSQGWFYGFHSDIWSAYAVGVTYLDKTAQDEKQALRTT
jgi:hypothetical protein